MGWTVDRELDADQWAAAGRRMGAIGRSVQWWLGDWIAYGNERFGERYARASKITGYDPQSLMNMVYVASRFARYRRRENLSWSHHETVAAMEIGEQEDWLDRATSLRWSVSDLRMMLRLARREGCEEPQSSSSSPAVRCPHCGEQITLLSEHPLRLGSARR